MKNFVYVIKKENVRKLYGGSNIKGNVYRVKNNKPEFITEFNYCTSYCKGEDSEILTAISKVKGQLTKKEKEAFKGLYYNFMTAEKVKINIRRI